MHDITADRLKEVMAKQNSMMSMVQDKPLNLGYNFVRIDGETS